MIRILMTLFRTLLHRKPRYLIYLFTGYLVPRFLHALFQRFPPPRLLRQWTQTSRMVRARNLPQERMAFTRWDGWPVTSSVRRVVDSCLKSHPDEEIVLGHVDNDGRLLGKFGPLPGWVIVYSEEFVPRERFSLDVVLRDGLVLIRKDFHGDRARFLREWHNLALLAGKANVPSMYRVDENRTLLYKNMILGQTVRDVLVEAGANILIVQTRDDPALVSMSNAERLQAVLARGTGRLSECFPESFFREMEQQIDTIHQAGVAGFSLTFGNVMVDGEGHPWFIDMEGAEAYRSLSNPFFLWLRDRDREKFNRIYARDVMTERKARHKLSQITDSDLGWYAPVDFGGGLAVDGFWTVDSGTGRWEYLNHCVLAPLLPGKRVLDLGSNNGLMPLMMLRDGAREVVGLELDPEMVERAHVVHEIFEWRDMRRYPLTIHTCDMRAILEADWGKFDVVTAYCSLYYLSEEVMARIVRRVAELAPVMVLQAKVDTRPEAEDNKAEKSSIPFLQNLLETNGFPHVEIHAPPGYSRPLLVGRNDQVHRDL
ncbi:MAG: class I SAM-dependent methyltransferase [Chloroflexota bacterium]